MLPGESKVRCAPARLAWLPPAEPGGEADTVLVTIAEGFNHQVKRMIGACGGAVR